MIRRMHRPEAGGVDLGAAVAAVLGTLGLLFGVVALTVASDSGADSGARSATPAVAADAAPVVATLTEFAIDVPATVPAGPVEVRNAGQVPHNLTVVEADLATPDLSAGETATLDLSGLAPGSYTLVCTVPGHEAAGMKTTVEVVGASAATAGNATPAAGAGPHTEDWEALDRAMTESILAFPAETEGRGNQLLEPEILPDGTKRFELTAAITPWEVEPGRVVDAWTYNGMVPGPWIRVDVGDTVEVVVHNRLPMGTDVHWHGVRTPNDQDGVAPLTQPLIRSGEDYTYRFVATEPAVGMYHAHHHGQMQVPNGLFAVFQIGEVPLPAGRTIGGRTIPADLTIADEIPMVLNDAGVIGYSLNGKSFPATEPYTFRTGDWFLVHYYNEGLQSHPMHLHQFPQLVIARDGIPLDNPWWADTINVAPGERWTVLVQASDPGTWVWHCHILNHVERDEGMFGMVTALVVE